MSPPPSNAHAPHAAAAPLDAAAEAVYAHGRAADTWPAEQALTASALAQI